MCFGPPKYLSKGEELLCLWGFFYVVSCLDLTLHFIRTENYDAVKGILFELYFLKT